MHTLTCHTCPNQVDVDCPPSNIKTIIELSHYRPIFSNNATFKWLCPSCVKTIVSMISTLHDFLRRDPSIFWDGLRSLLKHDGPLPTLDDDTYDNHVSTGMVIVKFWAPWSGPCKTFAPVFEATASKHLDFSFASVNTENCPDLALKLDVHCVPFVMGYRDGIKVYEQAGTLSEYQLTKLLDQIRTLDMDRVRREQQASSR